MVQTLLREPGIGLLAEVMNVPAVLAREPAICAKIASARWLGLPVDGHAPGLRGEALRRYVAAGIASDHECTTLDEGLEKIACGMHVLIREGSAARDFDTLHPLLGSHPARVMLCSDDKHPDDLVNGHIDRLVARAVAYGHDVFDVLRCACVNPVRHYRLRSGLLRIGDPMDAVEVTDLATFRVRRTWLTGRCVFSEGAVAFDARPATVVNCFNARRISPDALAARVGDGRFVRVIEVRDGDLHTGERHVPAAWAPDVARDVLLLAVVNRYRPEPPAVAFVHGFGLRSGALASSVAHDSHNIVAVGADAAAMRAAVNAVIDARGGLAVAGPAGVEVLPLPIAGLMSDQPGEPVAAAYAGLERCARELGSPVRAPLMTLSFLTLLVIPDLKLSDRGLFDARSFGFTTLAV